jgi:hypothetical protein
MRPHCDSRRAIAKAKERMGFAKTITLERAAYGTQPDPRTPAGDKRESAAPDHLSLRTFWALTV